MGFILVQIGAIFSCNFNGRVTIADPADYRNRY
jgi:hypothetical protein